MKILVMSCDKNEDLGFPFFHCMEKYWPNHSEVIYCSETIENKFYRTILKNYGLSIWTKRVREAIEEIDDNKILLMCDDVFINSPVSNDINKIKFPENVASINMQIVSDSNKKRGTYLDNNLGLMSDNADYKTSVMCSLGDKEKMLDVFSEDKDPGMFEFDNNGKGYKYCRLDKPLITGGGEISGKLFGKYRGKGVKETLNFLENEGLHV